MSLPITFAALSIAAFKPRPLVTQRKFKCEVLRYLRNEKIQFSNNDYGILFIKGVKVDYREDLEVCYLYFNTHQRTVGVCVPYISPGDLMARLQKYLTRFHVSQLRLSSAGYCLEKRTELTRYETFIRLKTKVA